MDTENPEKTSYRTEYFLAAGYALFFCIVFMACMAFYFWVIIQSRPSTPNNAFATNLPPRTPTPHILATGQPDIPAIFEDDFSRDSHEWSGTDDSSKKQLKDGMLVLQTQGAYDYTFATCEACPYLSKPFYLQVDLAASAATDKGFGIYFNFDDSRSMYLLFQINMESRKYYLSHYQDETWVPRAAGQSEQIKAYPAANTIGIYAELGFVEFYVNGVIVDSYVESGYPFYKGDFGFYVGDSDFELLIDNLTIRAIGN